jgi:dolichol-phosphate mannosyltransferase
VISAVGAAANIMLATNVYEGHSGIAGIAWLASVAGVLVGSVWNYAVSSIFTWKRR